MTHNGVGRNGAPESLRVGHDDLEPGPHPVGSEVTIRSVEGVPGRRAVGFAVAGVVLHDDDEMTVVASISGSDKAERAGERAGPRGRNIIDSLWNGSYTLGVWDGESVVRIHQRGQCWSIWRFHDGHDWSRAWYGNLEAPWRRTEMGYDTQDWTLDVVADGMPGTDDWEVKLKDEDELDWFVDQGVYTIEQAESIREVGQTLSEAMSSAGLDEERKWSTWAPPRDAQPSSLADGWRHLT
ncbi:DUF402 domain-containing protein [Brachybacterium sacelli]|uniref:DUF402 domain-containing protein n=1 Tax=Brachybacterium sacelli TaxID=173364 RepID=A0ABS4X0L9_9MICO|nr:DUF402 domain-containing protein [Brachybacterium sacelli]MBP2381933.1 hypothetical protein [Brachybacterium sacelli]